ncbi:S8 family peptidase [Streptomyces sp. NPDC018000]|uniref:S8 family peptidase n=1 Tax=Streptomyces sp. NPDC018000 TaxID=3365028 RepID=UPI0037BCC41A
MKRPIWALVTATAAAMVFTAIPVDTNPLLGTSPAAAAENGPVDPPLFDETQSGGTVRVNVVTDQRTDLASASEAGETLVSYDTLPLVTLRVDNAGLQQLNTQPGVISVTEDIPVAPTLNESTALIGSDRAAAAGKTGTGTTVAILDTGVAAQHPFLTGRVKTEACFSVIDESYGSTSLCPNGTTQQEGSGSADAETGPCATMGAACSHGTHVAGITAGNGTGISGAPTRGVAPGADIIAIQVFSKFDTDSYCGAGNSPCVLSFTSSQIKGLEKVYALKRAGTNIIAANMSLGGGRWTTACATDPRKMIIDNLLTEGVATVIAAGNNGYTDAVSAPGCVSSAITVGSTTDDDQLSTFTNRGPLLDLLAPGTGIVSSVPGGGFASKNGTSMAAPHVTGALAILRQTYPDKPLTELETILKSGGKTIGYTGATTPRIQLDLSPRATVTDFNCDGAEDTVVGDPKATVAADTNAGVVRVIYGGGKGTAELHQDLAAIPGEAESGDLYGENLATFDHNKDGCTDLVVGVPAEDIDTNTDAGSVHVVYGAPNGLSTGAATLNLIQGTGEGAIAASAPNEGDRFGHAVAAGHTAQGEPYLVIGVPGEDLGTTVDAGNAYYLRGSINVSINQDKPGVDGVAESGDMFGSSIAASANHVVIGAPGESIGTLANAGQVQVLMHNLSAENIPTPVQGINQNEVNSAAEAGDQFSASLAAVAYSPSGATTPTDTVIAVGSPGEALETVAQAGAVHTLRITSAGVVTRAAVIHAEVANVAGVAATDDRFGQNLVLVNLDPSATGAANTLVLAVGIPGKDVGTTTDAGAIQTFYPFGAPGDNDHWVQAGDASGIGGTPSAGHAVGSHLGATATRLYVGVPNTAPYGAAYGLPWSNATGGRTGTTGTATTYQPGQNGLPATGGAFGWAVS